MNIAAITGLDPITLVIMLFVFIFSFVIGLHSIINWITNLRGICVNCKEPLAGSNRRQIGIGYNPKICESCYSTAVWMDIMGW